MTVENNKITFFVRHCQNLRIFSYVNFKDFQRFGAFGGLVKQKNVVFIQFRWQKVKINLIAVIIDKIKTPLRNNRIFDNHRLLES
jgi:hypothetical protein